MAIRSKPMLLLVVLYLAVSLVLLPVGAARKKQSIDYDALERAWEAGDAREELRSPGDEQFEALSEKSEQEAKEHGAQMVFVTLREDRSNPQEPLAVVASRWKESLWNGGLEVTIYEIEEGKRLLVGLQRGIQIANLRQFLSEQPEVLEFEWNSKTYGFGSKRHKKVKQAAAKKSKRTKKRTQATQTSNTQEPKSEL